MSHMAKNFTSHLLWLVKCIGFELLYTTVQYLFIIAIFQSDMAKKYSLAEKYNDFSLVLGKVCFIIYFLQFT